MIALADQDFDHARMLVDKLHDPCRTRVLARLQIEVGRIDEAQAMLARTTSASLRDRIEVLLLRARVSNDSAALELVSQALELAEPEGYVRIFVDESSWIGAYVRRLVGTWPSGFTLPRCQWATIAGFALHSSPTMAKPGYSSITALAQAPRKAVSA